MTEEQNIIKVLENYGIEEPNLTHITQELLVLCGVSDTEGKLCDNCYDTDGFYLGTTCPKCNRPFRSVKA